MKKVLRGFTLIELIAVMLVVSIVAAYASFRTPSTSTFTLGSATEQLRRDIRYTQTLATSLNATYTLTTTTNSYTITPNPPSGAYTVTMPTGVTLSATSVSFNSMGAPAAAASITVTASGVGSNVLSILSETGFVNG